MAFEILSEETCKVIDDQVLLLFICVRQWAKSTVTLAINGMSYRLIGHTLVFTLLCIFRVLRTLSFLKDA